MRPDMSIGLSALSEPPTAMAFHPNGDRLAVGNTNSVDVIQVHDGLHAAADQLTPFHTFSKLREFACLQIVLVAGRRGPGWGGGREEGAGRALPSVEAAGGAGPSGAVKRMDRCVFDFGH